jgi:hypothetical protein
MYELRKKMESYLRVNLLGPGPRYMKKELTGPLAVSQRLRNTALGHAKCKCIYFNGIGPVVESCPVSR